LVSGGGATAIPELGESLGGMAGTLSPAGTIPSQMAHGKHASGYRGVRSTLPLARRCQRTKGGGSGIVSGWAALWIRRHSRVGPPSHSFGPGR
jgi:hypothetical protein